MWGRFVGWWKKQFSRLWHGVANWWKAHFSHVDSREAWGLGVWLFFAVIVAVPELWAVIWSDSARWPTISATVGELEHRHPWVALAVVALIVTSVYSTIRYPKIWTGVLPPRGAGNGGRLGDPLLPYRTPKGGRLTRSTDPVRELAAGIYFGCALLIIAAGTATVAVKTDIDDEYHVGQTLYGLTALLWVVVPSLLAWPRRFAIDVPFPTLYATLRSLERRVRILALAVAAGLAVLLIHLAFYPWPAIVPDLQRLHESYNCHPLQPARHPLSAKEKAECAKVDEAHVVPPPTAP